MIIYQINLSVALIRVLASFQFGAKKMFCVFFFVKIEA